MHVPRRNVRQSLQKLNNTLSQVVLLWSLQLEVPSEVLREGWLVVWPIPLPSLMTQPQKKVEPRKFLRKMLEHLLRYLRHLCKKYQLRWRIPTLKLQLRNSSRYKRLEIWPKNWRKIVSPDYRMSSMITPQLSMINQSMFLVRFHLHL